MPIARVIALSLVLAGCDACGAVPNVDPAPGLTLAEQESLTVHIDACDYTGSGVIVSRRHVVTAFHVASACPVFVIEAADKSLHVATLELAHRTDLARLVVEDGEGFDNAIPVEVGEVHQGDGVCHTHASPTRGLECGEVTGLEPFRPRGQIRIDAKVSHGNSGGPLWNGRAELVGVVVTCDTVSEGSNVCLDSGGGASMLRGLEWIADGAN